MPDNDGDVKAYQMSRRIQFPVIIIVMHWIFMILFGVFVRYTPHQAIAPWNPANLTDGTKAEQDHPDFDDTTAKFDPVNGPTNLQFIDVYYPMFEDVQVMVFIGFAFLIAFMRFFALTAVSMSFVIACFSIEWCILMNGWFQWVRKPETTAQEWPAFTCGWGMGNEHDACTPLDIRSITNALFGCTTVLISGGCLLGKISPTQMVINSCFEITLYAINRYIILDLLEANDSGHGMSVHAFGAYWGLACACVVWTNKKKLAEAKGARESYISELFVFLGTLFLFTYWPSWNAFQDTGVERHRAVVNTFLSIISSCITTYALSAAFDKKGRFTVQHLQNATLAGGVGIGSIANGVVHPFGALLIGMMAGVISVIGYQFLTPALNKLGAHDSAGVHNLHGITGIYASIISAIVAGSATARRIGSERAEFELFPAMAPESLRLPMMKDGKLNSLYIDSDAESGDYPESDRDWNRQGGLQFVAVLITMCLSISGGVLTGLLLRLVPMDSPDNDHLGEDTEFFVPLWDEIGGHDAPLHNDTAKDELRLEDMSKRKRTDSDKIEEMETKN